MTDQTTRTNRRDPGGGSDSRPSPGEVWRGLSPFHRSKALFILAGLVSLALSVGLWATGNRSQAIFVGLWVPSILSLGTLVLTGEGGTGDE